MEAKLEGTAEGLTIQDIHSAMKVLDEEVNWPDPLKAAAKLVRAISKEILAIDPESEDAKCFEYWIAGHSVYLTLYSLHLLRENYIFEHGLYLPVTKYIWSLWEVYGWVKTYRTRGQLEKCGIRKRRAMKRHWDKCERHIDATWLPMVDFLHKTHDRTIGIPYTGK